MAVALRLAMVVIALACASLFLFHPWWFPVPASTHAAALDRGLTMALAVFGSLFVLAQLALFMILGRRHGRPGRPGSHGNWKVELTWAVAITALFFWFNVSGERLWSRMTAPASTGDAVQVEVTGVQFQWYFRYPGADGVLGRVNAARFARPDEGNPLGIDPADLAGQDDIVSSTLLLPVGREADLILRAQDVIHSVFIPAMRFKQDAVPGMDIHAHFTPTETGTYELVCSQLCGLGHYRMRAVVRVVKDAEFKQWLKVRGNKSVAASSP
jgi:cytochrome c oxidase subunit II